VVQQTEIGGDLRTERSRMGVGHATIIGR
jgi:hypothetical protein